MSFSISVAKQDKIDIFKTIHARNGRYVPTLSNGRRLKNERMAFQEHTRMWLQLLRCSELHFGICNEAFTLHSYYRKYKIVRTYDVLKADRTETKISLSGFKLLDERRENLRSWKLDDWILHYPKRNDDWLDAAQSYDFISPVVPNETNFNPANGAGSSHFNVYTFPMFERISTQVYDRNTEESLEYVWLRSYRLY